MKYEEIEWEVIPGDRFEGGRAGENDVGIIRLKRPDKLNSITPRMRTELDVLLDEVRHKNHIRVVILTGEGRAFSTGGDLDSEAKVLSQTHDDTGMRGAYKEMVEFAFNDLRHVLLQRIAKKLEDLPQPTIAAINGWAVGAGLELATCCDMRMASESAVLGEVAVPAGFVTESGGARNLPKLIGKGRALDMILRGRRVPASEALEMGLVEWVVDHDSLMTEAIKVAGDIATNPWLSVRKAKELVHYYWTHERSDEGWQLELDAILEITKSRDCWEGVESFIDKRDPDYRLPFDH